MRICNQYLKFCFALLFILTPYFAQAQKVTLKSGNYNVYLGDDLNIPLRIENITTIPKIEFPSIKNIKFSAGDRANSFSYTSIINNKVTRTKGIEVIIIIRPQALGTYSIPGIFYYNKNNQKQKTAGFTIRVLKPKINDSLITEIISNKKKYYQGEEILLELKWYLSNRIDNYNIAFDLLKKKEFYNLKNLPIPKNVQKKFFRFSPLDNIPFAVSQAQKNNKNYTLYSSKFSLFVEEHGIWNEAVFSIKGNINTATNKRDFFGRVVFKPERVFVESPLLELEILPLPTPIPKDFSKGVGVFQAKKIVSPTNVKIGEAIIYRLQIKGKGNFYAINSPSTSIWEKDFEVYHRQENTQIRNNLIEFSYILRAKNEQIKHIPEITFTYFDLSKEDYNFQTLGKTAIQVEIAEKLSLDNVVSFVPLEKKKKEAPEIIITPQFSKIENPINIGAPAIPFLFFPPLSFLALIFFQKQKRKKRITSQKQALLAKYTFSEKTDFSKKILFWLYQFLLKKEVSESKMQSIIFHWEKLNQLKNCNQKETALLEKLRLLYKEIVFGKKKITPEQEAVIKKEIKTTFYG